MNVPDDTTKKLPVHASLRTIMRVLWITAQLVLALWMASPGGRFYYQGF